jgi:hypothetical protein
MEDDLTFLGKWKTTSVFLKMEDDLSFLRRENDLNFLKMEDNLIFL